MKTRVKLGEGRTFPMPPHLGGLDVPAEGMEVDDSDLFIRRRLDDGDLVKLDAPASEATASVAPDPDAPHIAHLGE
jgi:hypothetical protein